MADSEGTSKGHKRDRHAASEEESQPKVKKHKQDKKDAGNAEDAAPEAAAEASSEKPEIIGGIAVIASPLAGDKLTKKCLKLVRKAAEAKAVRKGVKEVVKGLRKGEKGLLVLAGNITPIDVISHLPCFAEEKEVPYVFVAAKEELGAASNTKRPTSCVLVPIKKDAEYAEYMDAVVAKVKEITPVYE